MPGSLLRVGDPVGQSPAAVGRVPTRRRRTQPALLPIGTALQDLEEALRGDVALLVRVAALEEVRLFQEVAALRVCPHRWYAFAGDQRLDDVLLGRGLFMLRDHPGQAVMGTA